MVNSDFSCEETVTTVVEGVTKFEHLKWKDKLPIFHPKYHPLHLSADYNRHERKVDKFLAETKWILPESVLDQSWCHKLPELKVHGSKISKVSHETYLGDVLSDDGKNTKNVKNRNSKGIGIIS